MPRPSRATLQYCIVNLGFEDHPVYVCKTFDIVSARLLSGFKTLSASLSVDVSFRTDVEGQCGEPVPISRPCGTYVTMQRQA